MEFKSVCLVDLLDQLEDFDGDRIEVRAMTKDGRFLKIYEINLVDFFSSCDLYLPFFKIGISGQRSQDKVAE